LTAMTEIRCVKCKRLLMVAEAVRGEIKCGKCGFINKVDMMLNFVIIEDPDLPKGEWRILPTKS